MNSEIETFHQRERERAEEQEKEKDKKISEINAIDTFWLKDQCFNGSNRICSEMYFYLLFATGTILWLHFTNNEQFLDTTKSAYAN